MYNLPEDFDPQELRAVLKLNRLGQIKTIDMDVMPKEYRNRGKMAIVEFTKNEDVNNAIEKFDLRYFWLDENNTKKSDFPCECKRADECE